MKIATWNINGIKARIDAATTWLKAASPDIACLQEIKCVDEAFPRFEFEALGYNVAVHGQKGFNGVALLSKLPLEDVTPGLAGDAEDVQASSERRFEAAENVQQTIERFCQQTDWRPERIKPVAGALLYTKYGVLKRLVMKLIVKQQGGPTDTSRDYDFTDWEALARFAEEFADELVAAERA